MVIMIKIISVTHKRKKCVRERGGGTWDCSCLLSNEEQRVRARIVCLIERERDSG